MALTMSEMETAEDIERAYMNALEPAREARRRAQSEALTANELARAEDPRNISTASSNAAEVIISKAAVALDRATEQARREVMPRFVALRNQQARAVTTALDQLVDAVIPLVDTEDTMARVVPDARRILFMALRSIDADLRSAWLERLRSAGIK
ncbi:MAG: hypothetical protein ABMA15_10430 [Vicinamibacterales bacterium]